MSFPTSNRGILARFDLPDEALAAARRVRDAGYTHFDVLTPFPVHGMDEAMGLKRSWVPWVSALLAFGGILAAQVMMSYIMVIDWPMNFGGKPFFAWPSFVPITFELMVLFSAIGSAVVAIFAGKRFTVPQPPALAVDTGATRDKFVIWISATDPQYAAGKTRTFVEGLGAHDVEPVEVKEAPRG
jgi:hypothetical protein